MITRIELTNFMSHEHTVIEPAAGLTVLVGPNNCGKSALVAALQILCSNETSTYVKRHGARECSVKVETDDEHVIEWRRKDSPSYVIDGKTFDRLGIGGLPDELHALLRLPTVNSMGDTDFDVHFGMQKSPIFLLESASNAAKFFAASSDASHLVAMQRRHKEKLAEAQREKNRLEAESKEVNAGLAILEPVVDLAKRLEAAQVVYDAILEIAERVEEAEEGEAELRRQSVTACTFSAQVAALGRLSPPPEIVPTEPLQSHLSALVAATGERALAGVRATSLSALTPPPELAPIQPLLELIEARVRGEAELQAAMLNLRALQPLSQPPQLTLVEPVESLLRNIEIEIARGDVAESRTRTLVKLQPPPGLLATSTLERSIADIARSTRAGKLAEGQSASLAPLILPPRLADVGPLTLLLERFEECDCQHAVLRRRTTLLDQVSPPPELEDELALTGILAEITTAIRHAHHWRRMAGFGEAVAPLPPLPENRELCELIDRLDASSRQVVACEILSNAAAGEVDRAAADLRAKAAGGICPVCGAALDADRLLSQAATGFGGHAHG